MLSNGGDLSNFSHTLPAHPKTTQRPAESGFLRERDPPIANGFIEQETYIDKGATDMNVKQRVRRMKGPAADGQT